MSDQMLASRINHLEELILTLSESVAGNEILRKQLLAIVRGAVARVESPWDVISRMYMEPHQSASMRAAMQMGLVEALTSGSKTADELATITECDKLLIVRILRPLTYLGIFAETGFEEYTATPTTHALAIPAIGGGFKFMFDEGATACAHLPTYLAQIGFQNPQGGCFQSAFQTSLDLFPWLMEHPQQMANFNDLMAGQRQNRTEWYDICSVDQVLIRDFRGGDSALLVDIGGNRGYDLEGLKSKHTSSPGNLVLQDLPQVIGDITGLNKDILAMEYDFFTPQPVKGARAYYMRYILHDYSDIRCREILRNVVEAMTPGYSKLLIFEFVLPDTGAPLFPSLLDINMMALLSGMERTEKQWQNLLDSVGLEVVKFWKVDDPNTEGLIEAVVKL